MKMEDWEKVQQYDLGAILEDCTFLSHESLISAIEGWWKRFGQEILEGMLRRVTEK